MRSLARFTPALIYSLHLGLVAVACPPDLLFGGEPVFGVEEREVPQQGALEPPLGVRSAASP